MKRIAIISILCCALAAQTVCAEQTTHHIDIQAGGGIGSLDYRLPEGKVYPAYMWTAGVGYTWYFLPVLGLQTGVQVTRLGSIGALNGDLAAEEMLLDSEGEAYIPHTHYTNWHDTREAYFVEVPLAFRVRWYEGKNRAGLHAAIGAKLSVPVYARHMHLGGTISHYGYYPEWDLTLRDLPDRFTTEEPAREQQQITQTLRRWNAALYAELGTTVRCAPHTEFMIAAYAQYAVTTLAQPEMCNPWAAGLKVGVTLWVGKTAEQKQQQLRKLAAQFPELLEELHPCSEARDTTEVNSAH